MKKRQILYYISTIKLICNDVREHFPCQIYLYPFINNNMLYPLNVVDLFIFTGENFVNYQQIIKPNFIRHVSRSSNILFQNDAYGI